MLCTFGWSAASRKVFAKKDVPNAVLSWSDVWKRVYPAGLTAALDIGLSNLAITTGLHINIYTVRSRTTRVDRNPKKKKRGGEKGEERNAANTTTTLCGSILRACGLWTCGSTFHYMLAAIILPYVDDNAVDFAVALHSKVCKSTVLVFTLLFAIMFRLQKATWQLALVITLIFGGVVLFLAKSTGGDPIDGLGFLLVMIASVMEACDGCWRKS